MTQKQAAAAKYLVENGGNASKAMLDAGYSEATAKTPSKLTKSKNFVELLESQGLTDEFLIDALVKDIKNKPGNRKAELELAFKVKGHFNTDLNQMREVNPVLVQFIGGEPFPEN